MQTLQSFEWDDEKNMLNQQKHQVDFVDAMLIFKNEVLTVEDARRVYGEPRFRSVGMIDDDCFVVVHTPRGEITRLISAWKGGSDERNNYCAHVISTGTSDEGSR